MQSSKHNQLLKMHPTHFLLLLLIGMSGIIFFACESSSQRPEVTQAQVQYLAPPTNKEIRDGLNASQQDSKSRELEVLKSRFEEEYRRNETRISEIKAKMKRVSTLEQANKKLKASIETYQQGQVDWDLFKRAFNYDMQALGKELEDLSGHSKK